jgi:hypothetical protein
MYVMETCLLIVVSHPEAELCYFNFLLAKLQENISEYLSYSDNFMRCII